MRFTLVATRKGSIPMFMSLEMVEGASFVWRVERTKWPVRAALIAISARSEEHTSELQSRLHLVCRLLLEKKKECGHLHWTRTWGDTGRDGAHKHRWSSRYCQGPASAVSRLSRRDARGLRVGDQRVHVGRI